jgi:peptidoglycan/xylan/chitin deacetylase (PgdA/CDA1 family)
MATAIPILVYHSVSDEVDDRFRTYAVTPQQFSEHVNLLRELGYTTLTLSDAAGRLFSGGALPDRAVVLTFDDAFGDFAENAFPVLRDADFVASLFVPSAYVGSTSRWLTAEGEDQRPVMNWDELHRVADAGIELGAHSHTHPQLDRLSQTALHEELATSKATLEDRLGRAMTVVAYPFGFHSGRVRRTAQAAGYTFGCAVGNLTATRQYDRWAIPRLTVKDTTDNAALRRLLTHETGRFERAVSDAKRVVWRARRSVKRT